MKSLNILALLAIAFGLAQVQATNWFEKKPATEVEKEDIQVQEDAKKEIASTQADLDAAKKDATVTEPAKDIDTTATDEAETQAE